MAGNWYDSDDDDDDTGSGGGTPPALPEPARKHLRKLEKELAESKAKLAEYEADRRKSSLADVVKAKGFDPKVASLIPATVDGSDAVEKWLEEHGSMFAKANTDTPAETTEEVSGLDPVLAAQIAAVTQVTANAITPTKMQGMRALIEGAKDKAELDRILELAKKGQAIG